MEGKNIKFVKQSRYLPSKYRTKNWIGRNDDVRGTYSANSQIKFKTTILKLSLCDYMITVMHTYL